MDFEPSEERACWPTHCRDVWKGGMRFPSASGACAAQYFNPRKLSIYSGSNEIQRNIIAKSALGL